MPESAPPGDPGFATKSDLAYTRVRGLILSGELAPGAVLPQASLAQTDRHQHHSPARGAAAAQAGGPGRARRAPRRPGQAAGRRPRPATCWSCGAASTRSPRPSPHSAGRTTDLGRVRAALDGLEALSTSPSLAQLESHHRFHAAIHRASHNALLIDVLDGLWVKTDRYRRHGLETGRSDEERDARATEHRLLFEAVRDGDADTAADLMRRHVETSLGARSADRLAGPDVAR